MPRITKTRSHTKARARTDSRAPGSRRKHYEPEGSPDAKYAARARYKAKARADALNNRREPSIDLHMVVQQAMEKHGFEPRFSLVVNAKANALDESTVKRVGATVRDLRYLLWSSIGKFESFDFDRIEYCERGQGGQILVKVAIADVDAFVPKGSILDMRAQANATSIYARNETFPMLPDSLSLDLSSFPMERDRLAIVVEFAVLPRGNIRPGKIYRAVVRNKAQLAYAEVNALLEEAESDPEMLDGTSGLEGQIKLQDEASLRISKFELETREVKAIDRVLGLHLIGNSRAKRITENFTITAAGVMSGFLEGANAPVIRRVVSTPKSWGEIVGVANAKGFMLPAEPDALRLLEFLENEKKASPEGFPSLSLTIAKLLGQGEYAVFDKTDSVECFCPAVAGYAPGTAPNQKYMDLVIQRLLKAALAHAVPRYGKDELAELAEFCTEREHAAKKVEASAKYADA